MKAPLLVLLTYFLCLSLNAQIFNPDKLREGINQWHLDNPIPENTKHDRKPRKMPSEPGQKIDRVEHLCHKRFLSGANIAWNNYANDLGNYDSLHFETVFTDIEAHGGNSVRFWLHTNGVSSPEFNDGIDPLKCTGFDSIEISNLVDLVNRAWAHGIAVQICIWTQNMLYDDSQTGMSQAIRDRNRAILEDTIYTQHYIDNALIPMVNALKGNPGVLAYEIFNEPEGMCNNLPHTSPVGWTAERTEMRYIQCTINQMAGAIHRTDINAQVTNGAWDVESTTDVDGHVNYYKDDSLISRGGDVDGYLDFYEVHYYSWAKDDHSPFSHDVSYWQLDKPLVIAEFYSQDTYGVLTDSLFNDLYKNGYAGGWAWTYKKYWNDIKPGMTLVNTNYGDDINWGFQGCYVVYADFTTNNQKPCTYLDISFNDESNGDIDSWSWDFGIGSNPSSAMGPGPHSVQYSTIGAKNVQLIVSKGAVHDTLQKTNYLLVSEGHKIDVFASDDQRCDGSTTSFTSQSSPSFIPAALVTGKGSGGFNSTATQIQKYSVSHDGTISPSISNNLSKYLFGLWKSTWGTWVEFTANFDNNGTFYLKSKSTSGPQTVEAFIDGVSQGTMTMNNTGTFSVNAPIGTHVVKFAITSQDWVNVEEYGFTNLIPKIDYQWKLNNNNLTGDTIGSLLLSSLIHSDKIILEATSSDFNCLVPSLLSNEIEMNCVVTEQNEVSERSLKVYPNPFSEFFTISATGIIKANIYNSSGQLISSNLEVNKTIHMQDLPPGVYFLKLSTEKEIFVYKLLK